MTTEALDSLWLDSLASAAHTLRSSAIRDLLKLTEQPHMISFAGGLPAPQCFPIEELALASERVLVERPLAALQYGPTEGYAPLREWLAARMASQAMPLPFEQLILTSGSQQALDLLGKLLIDDGAPVLVEEPTYLGALQAWRPYRPRFVGLPMDEQGLRTDVLAQMLDEGLRPRFLYSVSSFQNPTGVTLSRQRREELIALAARYRLPIVEDDPYGELRYSGEGLPTLAALDIAAHGTLRHVVYLSTFSKTLAPGLRVGWALLPATLVPRFVQAKQGIDLHTSSLSQAVAYEASRDGLLDRHTPIIIATYRERRDVMLASLAAAMPEGVRWTRPEGGMFLWLSLPDAYDSVVLLEQAIEQQVAFVPGSSFFANGGGANTARLNFSYPSPERIREGIGRLGAALQR
jgi:2-aminoadipate transaminase